MLPLFLIVFIDLIGFGIVIPLLPFYAEHYDASPDVVVLVMAIYSLAQFVAAPYWGAMSDKVGRRPVLLITLAGSVASYLWLAYADTLLILFAARAFSGFMAGNISTAFAYVADVTTKENRAKGMGLIGAAFGIGFIVGPAIGGILAGSDPTTADFQTPAFAAAGLSALALVLAVIRLKESLSPELRERIAGMTRKNRRQAFQDAIKRPQIGLLIAISFLATFVFAGMETTFAMWSRREFGWGPEQNGYLFAFIGIVSAAIQGGAIGRLAKKFGERALIIQGALALALGMAMIPFSGGVGLGLLIAAMCIIAFGFSIINPSLNSLISLNAGDDEQGSIFGVTRSMTTLSRVVGPAWAGMIFASVGRDWPYFAGTILMLVVMLMAFKTRQPAKEKAAPACEPVNPA